MTLVKRRGGPTIRLHRFLGDGRSHALGAVGAQATQALASFALQVLSARLLGIEGLGRFATLYGLLILATAICSGFVGDSLTVLSRSVPIIRAGIQYWLLSLAVGAALAASVLSWSSGFVDIPTALAFGAATAAFLVEDALRRLLMATMLFWRIVAVDLTSLIASLTFIVSTGSRSIEVFLLGLLVGQLVAAAIAVLLLPREERWLAPMRSAGIRTTAAYGVWRSMQQAVRPALLAGARIACLTLLGVAATGRLEAARIYMAPALLVVGGLSSYLFSSYAKDKASPLPQLLRRADRSVLALLLVVAVFGAAAALAIPTAGPLLTGGQYTLSRPAVAGWAAYAASVAAVTPYGSLAAVRGRQVVVLTLRAADSALSLLLAALVMWQTGSIDWVPCALAVGSLTGGVCIRQTVLRRML